MKLTQATAVAIATAVSQIRDDWDHAGILAALRLEAERGTPAQDVFVAVAQLATNREARTPGLLNRPGRHWTKNGERIERRGDHNQPCPDHPDHDMPCTACESTRYVPTEEDRMAWRRELAARTTVPPRQPAPTLTDPDTADRARARIDAERATNRQENQA